MGMAPALRGAGNTTRSERNLSESVLKMSIGERSRSWTLSTRRTPMRVVGLGAIAEDGSCGRIGFDGIRWCLKFRRR